MPIERLKGFVYRDSYDNLVVKVLINDNGELLFIDAYEDTLAVIEADHVKEFATKLFDMVHNSD